VISSDISPACEGLFEAFVRKWYIERLTPQAMQQSLDAYWKSVEECLIEGG
jgi:hypothetical protein